MTAACLRCGAQSGALPAGTLWWRCCEGQWPTTETPQATRRARSAPRKTGRRARAATPGTQSAEAGPEVIGGICGECGEPVLAGRDDTWVVCVCGALLLGVDTAD